MIEFWIAIWLVGLGAGILGGLALGRASVLKDRLDALELDVDRILGRERARRALNSRLQKALPKERN